MQIEALHGLGGFDPDDLAVACVAALVVAGLKPHIDFRKDEEGRAVAVEVHTDNTLRASFPMYPIKVPAALAHGILVAGDWLACRLKTNTPEKKEITSRARRFYHVETHRQDGSWRTFTVEPLCGLEAAEKQLEIVREIIAPNGTNWQEARLRELNVVDMLNALREPEKDMFLCEHVDAIGDEEFFRRLAEIRGL